MTTPNIKPLESMIRSQLKALGYFSIEIQDEHEKSFNVIADGNFRNVFIKVLVRLLSEHIKELNPSEIEAIKRSANSVKKEPWAAIMSVNEKGELVDGITWKNLSRQTA